MTEPTEWVMVPREPTEEMTSAMFHALLDGEDESDAALYRAAIAAAPTPPSSPPLDVVRLIKDLRDAAAECTGGESTFPFADEDLYNEAATALTAQAKRIEGLGRDVANAEAWADNLKLQLASAKGWEKRNLEAANAAEDRATTAEAEIERMKLENAEAARIAFQLHSTVCAERDTARAALKYIVARGEVFDAKGTHSKAVCDVARAALRDLAALPSPILPPTKGEGK